MQIRYLVVMVVVVAGCQATPPVISEINDSSVKVQGGMGTTDQDYRSKAREGCGIYSKTEVPISHVCLDQYCLRKEVLFACK